MPSSSRRISRNRGASAAQRLTWSQRNVRGRVLLIELVSVDGAREGAAPRSRSRGCRISLSECSLGVSAAILQPRRRTVYLTDDERPRFPGLFLVRMVGLEPSTFCMAKRAGVRARWPEFAETCGLQRLRVGRANGSERERTLSAAIAAIAIVATFNSRGSVARPRTSDRR